MNYCEFDGSLVPDSTLRFACGAPAVFGLYDPRTLDNVGYVCLEHVGRYPRDMFGTYILPGVNIPAVREALGA